MAAGLMDRKIEKRFRLLDVNGDGYIVQDDYDQVARRFLHGFGESLDSPKGAALREAYLDLWLALARIADTDNDGRISREEFVIAMEAGGITSDAGFIRAVGPVAEAMVMLVDTDGDGVISFGEYARMVGCVGVPGTQARDAFTRLDRDGTGRVGVEQVTEAVREFYTSRDPQSPGNWLFGRF